MDWSRFLTYLLVMAGVTYLIRMLPLAAIRGRVRSVFLQSFLYYVPYAVLGAMTFPAVFSATGSWFSALAGTLAALVLGWMEKGLLTVAAVACAVKEKSVRVLHFSPKHGTIILAILGPKEVNHVAEHQVRYQAREGQRSQEPSEPYGEVEGQDRHQEV